MFSKEFCCEIYDKTQPCLPEKAFIIQQCYYHKNSDVASFDQQWYQMKSLISDWPFGPTSSLQYSQSPLWLLPSQDMVSGSMLLTTYRIAVDQSQSSIVSHHSAISALPLYCMCVYAKWSMFPILNHRMVVAVHICDRMSLVFMWTLVHLSHLPKYMT